MPRKSNVVMLDSRKGGEAAAIPQEDPSLDEACFLAALRRAVEGAATAAEERLAEGTPDWSDRFGRICTRLAR